MARPKTSLLSRRSVIEAALKLIDDTGLSGWSLRKLAEQLGVHESSVYYYYRYKSEIYADVLRYVLAEFDDEGTEDLEDWKAYLLAFGPRYYQALAAHPNVVGVLLQETPRTFGLAREERTADVLLDVGFPARYVIAIREQLEALIVGSLQFAVSDLFGEVPEEHKQLHLAVKAARDVSAAEQFDMALQAYVEGLEVQLTGWLTDTDNRKPAKKSSVNGRIATASRRPAKKAST